MSDEEIAWAKETVALGLGGYTPQGEHASGAFDAEYEEALGILYPDRSDS